MNKTTAQKSTQSPKSQSKAKKYAEYSSESGLFFSLALDMTWKLAFVVLIPVILGSFIDNHYKVKGNAYLLAGLALGFVLSVIVIRSTVRQSNEITRNMKVSSK